MESSQYRAELAAEALKAQGCQVFLASNGNDAIVRFEALEAQSEYVDLVLLDTSVSDMTLQDIVEEIRQHESARSDAYNMPIIAMSVGPPAPDMWAKLKGAEVILILHIDYSNELQDRH